MVGGELVISNRRKKDIEAEMDASGYARLPKQSKKGAAAQVGDSGVLSWVSSGPGRVRRGTAKQVVDGLGCVGRWREDRVGCSAGAAAPANAAMLARHPPSLTRLPPPALP